MAFIASICLAGCSGLSSNGSDGKLYHPTDSGLLLARTEVKEGSGKELIYDIELSVKDSLLYIVDKDGHLYSAWIEYNDSDSYYTDNIDDFIYTVPFKKEGFTYIRNSKDTIRIKVDKDDVIKYLK